MGTRRVSALAVVAAGLLTAGLLAGCAKSGTSSTTGAAPTASGSPEASATASPEPGITPSTTTPPGGNPAIVPSLPQRSFAGGASETLVGDLQEGVEPNCLLLRTSANKLYQLVGGDRTKLKGTKHVTVDGRELPAMATTCQQGIPFLVTNIH